MGDRVPPPDVEFIWMYIREFKVYVNFTLYIYIYIYIYNFLLLSGIFNCYAYALLCKKAASSLRKFSTLFNYLSYRLPRFTSGV